MCEILFIFELLTEHVQAVITKHASAAPCVAKQNLPNNNFFHARIILS